MDGWCESSRTDYCNSPGRMSWFWDEGPRVKEQKWMGDLFWQEVPTRQVDGCNVRGEEKEEQ